MRDVANLALVAPLCRGHNLDEFCFATLPLLRPGSLLSNDCKRAYEKRSSFILLVAFDY